MSDRKRTATIHDSPAEPDIPPVKSGGVPVAEVDRTWVGEVHGMCFRHAVISSVEPSCKRPIDVCKAVLM
jgi:hypothetical protein